MHWVRLAHVMWSQGDISHAAAVTDQVVALADELGDKYLLSYVLGNELAGKMIVGDFNRHTIYPRKEFSRRK